MSGVRPDIDLAALERPDRRSPPPRRSWMRIALPLAILAAFALILVSSTTDLLRGAVEVTVVRPTPLGSGAPGSPQERVVLQVAGWAEPDPFPIQVTALAGGVVREMLVLESATVQRGDPIARLVDDDARLALASAEAALAAAQAEFAAASAQQELGERSFERALGVTANEAVTSAEARGAQADQTRRNAAVLQGAAQVAAAEDELVVQRELEAAGAAGSRQVELAEARVAEVRGGLEALRAEAALAAAAVQRTAAQHERARAELDLRLDDRLALANARAAAQRASAQLRAAETARDVARLRLDRMTVAAPADGVVLERLAQPGTVLAEGGAPVCTLFDPARLRVRVDIPQGDIGKVTSGQHVEILADARAGSAYHGEVVRLLQKADIQKVTLQAHVRVNDADALLRPEMLCQVRFLGDAGASSGDGSASDSVSIPSRLLGDDGAVWVIDGIRNVAVRRTVRAGARSGERVEIHSGLNLSDKLIDDGRAGLREGARVRVRGGP